MPNYVPACPASELPPGKGRTVTLQGVAIALFNQGGTFYAMSNTCPHRGGPLGEGDLEGNVVTCPWHGFQYDITTGTSADGKPFKLPTYPTRVTDGKVEIAIG